MGVTKYRGVEQIAEETKWVPSGDPSIPRRMRFLWRLSSALTTVGFPRGVRKYRSIEDANLDRDAWEQERVHRIIAERLRK